MNSLFVKYAGSFKLRREPTHDQSQEGDEAEETGQRGWRERPRSQVDSFASDWGLDKPSQELLESLELEVQDAVMQQFSPRNRNADVNGLFMKYARGMAKKALGHAQAEEGAEEDQRAQDAGMDNSPVERFAADWGLNRQSRELLESL